MWGDEKTSPFLFVLGSSVNNLMESASKYPPVCRHTEDVSRAGPVPGLLSPCCRQVNSHIISYLVAVTLT